MVDCWASLWGARSIFYRGDKDLTDEPSIAVVVQEMVPSERSGVMFTVDPSTGETGHIVIEAAFGQGEVVVSGQVEPDTYVVDKAGADGPRLLHVRVGTQNVKIVRGADGEDQRIELSPSEGSAPRADRRRGPRRGPAGAGHRGSTTARPRTPSGPWRGGRTYLVQSRPVTAVGGPRRPASAGAAPGPERAPCWSAGLAASAGRASGVVRVLRTPDEGRAAAGR